MIMPEGNKLLKLPIRVSTRSFISIHLIKITILKMLKWTKVEKIKKMIKMKKM